MRRIFLASVVLTSLASLLALASLSACGSNTEDNKLTETQMDDLDGLEGTISDDMINTDEITDEAPVDRAPEASAVKGERPKAKLDESEVKQTEEPAPVPVETEPTAE